MSAPMLKCGHASNALRTLPSGEKVPSCAICDCIETVVAPDLTGRTASCAMNCGATRPSSLALAFFEFRGQGSDPAVKRCRHCSYVDVVHDPAYSHYKKQDHDFTPHGAWDTDTFYCGCRGWD